MSERYSRIRCLRLRIHHLFTAIIFTSIISSFGFETWAQNWRLSDKAEISVITCGPFQKELYSAFGHSAFRVHDPTTRFDAAYNYGVFDFNQPNFYLNFARGYLYYKLGVYDYKSFEHHYVVDNRYVHEQVLNLTQEQKQKLFVYLQRNAQPGTETYLYDYFYNNCATKMRDVLVDALGAETVRFDGSYVKTDYTIRELTDLYLKEQPWGDLGIDICLGLPMDKKAAPIEYMFLPDYVESGFDHAFIRGSSEQPLVKKKNIIYEQRPQDPELRLPHPLYLFSAIALVAAFLTYNDLKKKKLTLWFDVLIFGTTGIIGLLLFFLWFFTDHAAVARNLNIIWAFPLHVVAVIAFYKNPNWLKNYFIAVMIVSLLLLVLWAALPQKIHYALIPLVFTQALRSFSQYRIRSFEEASTRVDLTTR